MQTTIPSRHEADVPEFLSGGGEMGALIRQYDWSATPLGPFETWPQSLRTCVRIMLTSRQPIWIGWGKELIKLYNDPYRAIVGGKHPWALGKPASVVWKDIWRDIEPMLKQVMEQDEGTYVESQLLIMERNGYPEETYYTFSYTPIPGDDGKTAGMFCANTDDTDRIISERQLRTLTQLGQRLADCRSNSEIIEKAIATLEENPTDFPFAFFRQIQDQTAVLAHSTPLGDAESRILKAVDLSSSHPVAKIINKALQERKPQVFENLKTELGELPKGSWGIAPENGLVIPIVQSGMREPYAILVVGLNPYRLLDEKYSSFFSLIADQIATSFSDVHLLEEERRRSEALAELDRAKTLFFSNISHEFRTPLTLLLGPIEETLHDRNTTPENKLRMDVAYRNALRMQKLVNTLLEFSRLEAGRVEGRFRLVDLCSVTGELTSTFRSAVEKAGLYLRFSCDAIGDPVYVDTDMWEKIVLNLLSNAFKYTEQGGISVAISAENGRVVLAVSDTGVGIPGEHLDKIFERFHRIENIQGRSQEGTGIGLALVKELVKLHGGTLVVASEPGKGSTFTVTLPTGKEHLPAEKIIAEDEAFSLSRSSAAYVEEALKWIPEAEAQVAGVEVETLYEAGPSPRAYRVVLADDNADMRAYVARLLAPQFEVITAVDGEEAYQKVLQFRPNLLLSDVMMPRLDGVGLLQKLRSHPELKTMPVVFLSARAGEEAKIEGLAAGADDYLVKPFTARELLARVDANIRIANVRRAAEANLRTIILQAPVAMAIFRGEGLVIDLVNTKALELWGKTHEEVLNRPFFSVFSELLDQGFDAILRQVMAGERFTANEMPVQLVKQGQLETVYLNFIYEPLRNSAGEVEGMIAVGVDVTNQVVARRKLEQSEQELQELANAVPQLVWVANAEGRIMYYNDRVAEFAGAGKNAEGKWQWQGLVHPDDLAATKAAWEQAMKTETIYQSEHRIQLRDGRYRWYLSRALPFRNKAGAVEKWFGSATDIHVSKTQTTLLEEEVRKRTAELHVLNQSLQQSNTELQQFAHVASHDLKEPLRKIKIYSNRLAEDPDNVLTEASATYIQKVNSAVNRMVAMVEGVLHYSVVNTSAQVIEPVSLQAVVQNIETDLEVLLAQKEGTIVCDELPVVEGSTVLLYQLFYNLVNNSLKFSRPGVPPVIRISAAVADHGGVAGAFITVEDNGIGFDQVYARKIFESFIRLHSKDQYEGTGLGLALCQRIALRHGGHIEALGRPGVGACFVVFLPLKQWRTSL